MKWLFGFLADLPAAINRGVQVIVFFIRGMREKKIDLDQEAAENAKTDQEKLDAARRNRIVE